MINISKAVQVRGWMQESELQWLAEQALTHRVIVEIGSFAGRSTKALADHTLGRVLAIDDFLGADGDRPLSSEASKALYEEFCSNLQEHIEKKKVTIAHPNEIGDIRFKNLAPDMVFIDGDHSYEGVSKDIQYWKSRLISGGLLCGHDAGHPPIKQAIEKLLPDAICAPKTTIWYVTKP